MSVRSMFSPKERVVEREIFSVEWSGDDGMDECGLQGKESEVSLKGLRCLGQRGREAICRPPPSLLGIGENLLHPLGAAVATEL